MSDGTTTYTAPDNGLSIPPATFTRTLEYPLTITVGEAGITLCNGEYYFSGILSGFPYWENSNGIYIYRNSLFWYFRIGTTGTIYYRCYQSATPIYPNGIFTYAADAGIPPAPTLEYTLEAPAATVSYGSITVDNPAAFEGAATLALVQRSQAVGFNIFSVDLDTGEIQFDLDQPLTIPYTIGATQVSPLILSRFQQPEIEFSFLTDELAIVKSAFKEVPEEYAADELNPSGKQDARAYLYKFSMTGYSPWLFTSFEMPITHGTDVYVPKHFEHSESVENVNMEQDELTLKSRRFWDATTASLRNPLGYFLPLRLEAVLYLDIYECLPDSDGVVTSVNTIFKGQVASASFDGPMIDAKCYGISSLFDRKIPNILMQPTCNYAVYSAPCGLLAADWKMSSTVVSYTAGSYEIIVTPPVFTDDTPTQARPTVSVFDHFFAAGKFEKGTASTFERRGVLDSVANGSNIKITLRHPFDVTPVVSETIYLWAGCDGASGTCKAFDDTMVAGSAVNPTGKFGNFDRFGGFPFVPLGNPTVAKVNKDYSQGGKK